MSTLIELPGGGIVEVPDQVVELDPGITVHQHKAGLRVIERWQKPVFLAIHRSFGPELQEIENLFWNILASRFLDYAGGVSLGFLGKIVGQPKGNRITSVFRTWIKARIRMNRSLGRPTDVIEVQRLVEATPFRYIEYYPASFDVEYTEPPVVASSDLAGLVHDSRAAATWGSVVSAEVEDAEAIVGSYDEDEASDDQGGADDALTVGGIGANVYTA